PHRRWRRCSPAAGRHRGGGYRCFQLHERARGGDRDELSAARPLLSAALRWWRRWQDARRHGGRACLAADGRRGGGLLSLRAPLYLALGTLWWTRRAALADKRTAPGRRRRTGAIEGAIATRRRRYSACANRRRWRLW